MKIHFNKTPYFLLALLLLTTGITFYWLTQKNPNIADTIGYVIAGENLATGTGLSFDDPLNDLVGPYFTPFAFQIRHENSQNLFLGFPPGFPILLALGILLTRQANFIFFVVPILSIAGIFLTFLLGKTMANNAWTGLFAATIVALTPLLWQFGLDVWAAVPALVFVLGGLLFYVNSRQAQQTIGRVLIFSVLAGLFLVYALYIRYANVTFLLAIGAAEVLTVRMKLWQEKWRWTFYLVVGLGLLSILAFNSIYYGGVTLTSYSPENGWYTFPPFSVAYAFGPSTVNDHSFNAAIKTLWQNFPFILLLTPLGWLTLKRPYGLLAALCILFNIGLYSVYAFPAEGVNGRFLLPIIPLIAISISSAIFYILHKIRNTPLKLSMAIGIILIMAWIFLPTNLKDTQKSLDDSRFSKAFVESWTQKTPDDMVIMSYAMNDHVIYYGNRSVLNHRRIPFYDPELGKIRNDLYEPCIIYLIDTLLANGMPVGYVKDGDKPLYDSFNVLQANYQLEPLLEDPQLYQVSWQNNAVVREEKTACIP